MNHLAASWSRLAWRIPTDIRGYPMPVGGQFAPSQASLDPDLFDPSEKMWPWIRGSLMDILEAFWRPRYGEWRPWTRIYLAGSLASYWHATLDFDTLVGVDTHRFVRDHPEFGGMSDPEVCQALTHEFITELDPLLKDWSFPPEPNLHRLMHTLNGPDPTDVYKSVPMTVVTGIGPMEMTWYVNAAAYDIRVIKPYAAYDVTNDRWAVHPDKMSKTWGAGAFSNAFWQRMADTADEIKAALNLPEPARTSEALRIYDRIHTDRGQAFSAAGRGVADPRSLQWIVLNRWGLLGPLEVAAHPGREMAHLPPARASQWSVAPVPTSALAKMLPDRLDDKADGTPEGERAYLEGLKSHIAQHGFETPVTVAGFMEGDHFRGNVWDGAHRVKAAQELGLSSVPTKVTPEIHRALHRQATSWRALHPEEPEKPEDESGPWWQGLDPPESLAWRKHPAVIIPEGGAGGRKRYTLHLHGDPVASRSTLAEAKQALEDTHGPQEWKRARPKPKLEVNHYHFGPTTEFSDPREYHYVENLQHGQEDSTPT